MKQLLIALLLIFSLHISVVYSQNTNEAKQYTLQDGQKAYTKAKWDDAIKIWETINSQMKAQGKESAELYYNLGNAYFRNNNIAKARVYYERALLINPSDKDIRANAAFAASRVEDKILVADTFFLHGWITSLQNIATSNTWAKTAMLFFLLLVIDLFLFFFAKQILFKKIHFYAGIVFLLITIIGNIFAYKQKEKIRNHNTAIITASLVNVVSSPGSESTKVFTLHAGTKIQVLKKDSNWIEIEIDNGSVGWLEQDKIEII